MYSIYLFFPPTASIICVIVCVGCDSLETLRYAFMFNLYGEEIMYE